MLQINHLTIVRDGIVTIQNISCTFPPGRITTLLGPSGAGKPASSQEAVLKRYPLVVRLETDRIDDALLHVQYGKAVAALVEPAIAHKFMARYPELQVLWVPLIPEDQVAGIGVALRRDQHGLIAQVDQAVRELKEVGIIRDLEAQWGIAP